MTVGETAVAQKDFRGVWRTRGGAVVRVLYWHRPWGRWLGKTVGGSGCLVTSWDADGNAPQRGLDLVERVRGEELVVFKFGQ